MPVLEAQYVAVIARGTGGMWREDEIRWELPLWRGWAYFHAARLMDGVRFRWPGRRGRTGRWLERVRAWARGEARQVPSEQ